MQIPTQVRFHGLERSEKIEAEIRERAAKLESFNRRITSCRVTAERIQHARAGTILRARIELTLPGEDVIITKDSSDDIFVAIRDAFILTRRKLQSRLERRRGKVKSHAATPHGVVVQLFEEYGFLRTIDGREIFFHRNSVLHEAFDDLVLGTEVRFIEEEGEEGPQASTVRVLGKEGGHELEANVPVPSTRVTRRR